MIKHIHIHTYILYSSLKNPILILHVAMEGKKSFSLRKKFKSGKILSPSIFQAVLMVWDKHRVNPGKEMTVENVLISALVVQDK